ncbi:MAG TPA: Gfo/Idh/MocA family oxidoreductase [Paenibacillaceae bacterium]
MAPKLRWGILGCAKIAINKVIPAILRAERGEIVAVASRGEEKARETAQRFGIPKAYGSYEALLEDPDIDAVYIPLPNHLHREWTIRAARAGKHVLCEKPLALTAAEAEEMVRACADAGVHLAEAFMYRHHPRVARIRQILASGEIGELRAIRGVFTFNRPEDKGDVRFVAAWGGGSIYDVGCYPISASRWITGKEPVAVTAHAFFSPDHDNVDMAASGLLEYEGGVALTFVCGMWAEPQQTLEIIGSRGAIRVPVAFVSGENDAGFYVVTDGRERFEPAEGVNIYTVQADNFARAVFGEAPHPFPPEDAVRNMRVIEACLRSARERRRIEL